MSRTFRRGNDGGQAEYVRTTVQPKKVTAEWIVGKMADHVNYELERMISGGEIDPSDKADYAAMINRRIVKSTPMYDVERRTGHQGRSASACHYFTVVVDNELNHIRKYLARRSDRRKYELPIAQLPADEARECGFISPESEEFSDKCRNVRQLDFRMDVNTLVGMLTKDECAVLRMRILGYTIDEIGDRLGCCRSNVKKTHIKNIRRKARACGFFPASEARRGRI